MRAPEPPVIMDNLREPLANPQPVIQDHMVPALGTAPHRVAAGETFTSISRRYGVTTAQLAGVNKGVTPEKLRMGQTLLIPGQPVRSPQRPLVVRADGRILADRPDPLAPAYSEPAEEVSTTRTRTGYLVGESETLGDIADRFYTTERELRRLNRLGDSDNVYPGRYILVPFNRQAPASPRLARRDA